MYQTEHGGEGEQRPAQRAHVPQSRQLAVGSDDRQKQVDTEHAQQAAPAQRPDRRHLRQSERHGCQNQNRRDLHPQFGANLRGPV